MKTKKIETLAWLSIVIMSLIVFGSAISLVAYVIVKGFPALSLNFIFGPTVDGGLSAPIVGTLYLIGLTLIMVVPLGVLTALYLSEFAPTNRLTNTIRYALDSLAGVPSVIFGLFGVVLFVMIVFGKANLMAGALTMSCLTLPFMVAYAEEALRCVPKKWREASLSVGATRWQTIQNIVLPSAASGIASGIIICTGRIVAETAPLLATVGFSPFIPSSPLDGARTLSLHLFFLATEAPSVRGVTRDDLIIQAMGVATILVLLVIILNWISRLLSKWYQSSLKETH
jgi:phosphate transport system permease protein